jgi:hypothetical protein
VPLLAALLLAGSAHMAPMRWFSSQPSSLELLDGSPVNTLLLDARAITPEFVREAARRRVRVLAVVGSRDTVAPAAAAIAVGADGLAVENESGLAPVAQSRKAAGGRLFIELRDRAGIACSPANDPILATAQGIWPGIRFDESGVSAGPTAAPWIQTNSGFVKLVRSGSGSEIWMANRVRGRGSQDAPRPGEYLRAIADAALSGGHWVVDLDGEFQRDLLQRDPRRLREWRTLGELLRFFAEHAEWLHYRPASTLAVAIDCRLGALSGGVLDMFTSQHIPVLPVTPPGAAGLGARELAAVVNLTPSRLTVRTGVYRLDAPEGWTFPPGPPGAVTLSPGQEKALGFAFEWIRDGSLRSNFGARVFNAPGALSSLSASPDGKTLVLTLVNYTDYPMEDVTVDFAGRFRRVRAWQPGQPARDLAREPLGERTRITLDRMTAVAAIEAMR